MVYKDRLCPWHTVKYSYSRCYSMLLISMRQLYHQNRHDVSDTDRSYLCMDLCMDRCDMEFLVYPHGMIPGQDP